MMLLSEILVALACVVLVVLAVQVIGAMPPAGSWVAFVGWVGIGAGAFTVGAVARQMPLPAALMLLVMAVLLWRQRRRIVYAVEHGGRW